MPRTKTEKLKNFSQAPILHNELNEQKKCGGVQAYASMRESLRFSGKIISATISRTAQKWFVSISVETVENPHLKKAE